MTTSVPRRESRRPFLNYCTLSFIAASVMLLLVGLARGEDVREISGGTASVVEHLPVCEDEKTLRKRHLSVTAFGP